MTTVKTAAFGGRRAVEEHAEGFATAEVDDRTGGGTTTWASGDGALRRQKLEFVKSRHFCEVGFLSLESLGDLEGDSEKRDERSKEKVRNS